MASAARDEAYPGVVAILEYLADHAAFFKAMLGPKGDPAFPARIKELMWALRPCWVYGRPAK